MYVIIRKDHGLKILRETHCNVKFVLQGWDGVVIDNVSKVASEVREEPRTI